MGHSTVPAPGVSLPLKEISDIAPLREQVNAWRANGESVALVPTMGNLHAGHLSLVDRAREAADRVVMSIFVNPTQFGAGEDFQSYPRTLDEDRSKLVEAGSVDLLFVPEVKTVYPRGIDDAVRLVLPALSRDLCGAYRPGHFDGVASVVCRLLNIVQPQSLVLGRKDYQQFVLMDQVVEDLGLPVQVLSAPIVREADGLAMSSRNRYLSAEERQRAPLLHEHLQHVATALRNGQSNYSELEQEANAFLNSAGFETDYVQIRRATDLSRPSANEMAPLVVLAAAGLGRARLIDNSET